MPHPDDEMIRDLAAEFAIEFEREFTHVGMVGKEDAERFLVKFLIRHIVVRPIVEEIVATLNAPTTNPH